MYKLYRVLREEILALKISKASAATKITALANPKRSTRAPTPASLKAIKTPSIEVAVPKRRGRVPNALKLGNSSAKFSATSTKSKSATKEEKETVNKIEKTLSQKKTTRSKKEENETADKREKTPSENKTPELIKEDSAANEVDIPLLGRKETRGRPRKYPRSTNGKSVIPTPPLKSGEVRKKRGRPSKNDLLMREKLGTIVGEKRKWVGNDVVGPTTTKKSKIAGTTKETANVVSMSPSTSVETENEESQEKIPSMQGATIQPISKVIPPHHATTSPNVHKNSINHLLSNEMPPAPSPYSFPNYDPRTPTAPPAAPYQQQIPPPSSSSYNSGYSPNLQPYPGQQSSPIPAVAAVPPPPNRHHHHHHHQLQHPQQLPPYLRQQYQHSLHPPYPLHNGPSAQVRYPPQIPHHPVDYGSQMPPAPAPAPAPGAASAPASAPAPAPAPALVLAPEPHQYPHARPRQQQSSLAEPPSRGSNGRIPITSIISQKIDARELPSMMHEDDTTREEDAEDAESGGEDEAEGDGEGEDDTDEEFEEDEDEEEYRVHKSKRTRRNKSKYGVDRENIKINKRIMSQDTEDVIKMFKKFDNEVLSNPEARKRLKKLDNFFVTGELMKEFYEEQYAMSSSSNPAIRLRKMDPAFSKLHEINCLVYNLDRRGIPNRHLPLDFVASKEFGGVSGEFEREAISGGNEKSKGRNSRMKKNRSDNFAISIYAPENGRRPNHGIDGGNQTLLVNPYVPPPPSSSQGPHSMPPLSSMVHENSQGQFQHQQRGEGHSGQYYQTHGAQSHNDSVTSSSSLFQPNGNSQSTSPILMYPKKITKRNIEEIRRSFVQLCTEINTSLQRAVGVEPAFVSDLATKVNASLDKFDFELNGPRPPQPPPPQTTSTGVPIYDLQPNSYTVYEILDEWFNSTPQRLSVAQRIERYGEERIRDEFEYNTFVERRSVVEFVERLSRETKVDIWVIANDCDKYIRDKSILDEFISEIELDVDDLFKRILRYRQRRG
ncbi:hypothetical protein KGF57_004062 [Candida theae]|uniref:Transcription activator GCR1-like domain-containing protein n=1 Tax=Candida theae TaxID=1198502 RepID=A0AAD5BC05_9ASCO|nr:uncharacterized protein KGF57_004062 [Candida theae]KAI5953070.1 hypothetical protein KGF57_004062 [Candida theae]